jgi:hypothetical protein
VSCHAAAAGAATNVNRAICLFFLRAFINTINILSILLIWHLLIGLVVEVEVEVEVGVVVGVVAPATPVNVARPPTIQTANAIRAARWSVRRTLTREGTQPPGRRGREIGVR